VNFNKLNFVALIISYFYFSYLKIFSFVPFHLLFLFIGITINLRAFKYVFYNIEKNLIYLFIFIFLICLNSYLVVDPKNLIKTLFQDVLVIFSIFYYVFSFIRNEKDISFFIKTIIYVGSFSMLVAIFQFFQFDFAWEMRRFFETTDAIVNQQLIDQIKPAGLAFYSITYSYHTIILASILFSRFINYLSINNFILFLFGFFAVFVSSSESAIFGFILAMLIFIFFNALRIYTRFLIVFTISALLILILFIYVYSGRDFVFYDMNRIYLFKAGLFAFKENFLLGLGGSDINEITFLYLENADISNWVKNLSIHNSFLLAFIKKGIFMLIPFLLLFYVYFKNLMLLKVENKYLYTFFYVYLISYCFHSFFHNAGMFNKDQLFWIIFAFLCAAVNIYKKKLN